MFAPSFKVLGVFGELDLAAVREGKPGAPFDAWLALPNAQRNEMDTGLREIFKLSCEKGFRARSSTRGR